ncbi:zinc finger Y-chromosomal protein 1-like isoform X2 [Cylas formicarius]|nr:zinc finger Y-chromosomal protein 1-like isoform X2 [Cylas formicarius]
MYQEQRQTYDVVIKEEPYCFRRTDQKPDVKPDSVLNINLIQAKKESAEETKAEFFAFKYGILTPKDESYLRYVRFAKCSVEGFPDKLVRHRHETSSAYLCEYCGAATSKSRREFEMHILNSHRCDQKALNRIQSQVFDCTRCDYRTVKKLDLTRHLRTHREGGRFVCGERYECFHCRYATGEKGSLVKHVRLHVSANVLPHECRRCSKRFNEKKSLDSHIVNKHSRDANLMKMVTNRIYRCDSCSYMVVSKSKLARHKIAKHLSKGSD